MRAILVFGIVGSTVAPANSIADSITGIRSCIRRAGDANGDGVPDLLVSTAHSEPSASVWLVSGKDGTALLRVRGRVVGDGFGSSIDGAGDVDGDGHDDFIVGAPGGRLTRPEKSLLKFDDGGRSFACVYSGLDGRVLFAFEPKSGYQRFGACVAGAGDVDGDGRPDVIVGFSVADVGSAGEAIVYSGRTGEPLRRFGDLMQYGTSTSGCRDLDADGHDDVLVGDGSACNERAGRLRAFSGRTGRMLLEIRPEDRNQAFPWSISAAGDLNGDKVPDILVSEESQFVRALSGKDGSTLHEWSSHGRNAYLDAFGSSLDSVGDLDGDGVPEIIIGANESPLTSIDEGYATVFSGKDGHVLKEYSLPDAGIDVSGLGDVDGDVVPDFALCIPLRHEVRIVSGKTFATIREIDWTKLGDPATSGKK